MARFRPDDAPRDAGPVLPDLVVDLDAPPGARWTLAPVHREVGRALTADYLRDFGGPEAALAAAGATRDVVTEEERAEIAGLAAGLGLPFPEVLFGTLYYDALKAALACTAFAVPTPRGPLHARNLDWWTEGGRLSTGTVRTVFRRGGEVRFTGVGWPGFAGVLSGVAPGRFAVTLNAVSSGDPPVVARPVVLLLREVLDTASSFAEAVERLAGETIASDCLLLVTGPRNEDMAVVERTPMRAAVRQAEGGVIAVANEYRALDADGGTAAPIGLTSSSAGRYACALRRLGEGRPTDAEEACAVLSAPDVRMGITVHHMVLRASTGEAWVRLP